MGLVIEKLLGGGYGWDISLCLYAIFGLLWSVFNPLALLEASEVQNLFMATIVVGVTGLFLMFKIRLVDKCR